MSVTREKLYEEIWAEPITKVSKHYGVSDSFLVRVLQRMNVPRPPMGYWAKLAVGKILPRPPLPEAGPGDELEWLRNGEPRKRRTTPCAPDSSQPMRVRRRAERPSQHHLVSGAKIHFENVRKTDAGYLKPTKKLLPDLIVSNNTLDRALDIANELFLMLEDCGYKVMFAPRDRRYRRAEFEEKEEGRKANYYYPNLWSPYTPTVVFIGMVAIGLTLFETTEQIEMRYMNGKYIPVDQVPEPKRRSWAYDHSWTTKQDMTSGRLRLQAYSPYYGAEWTQLWSETKNSTLETKLKGIVQEITDAATIIAEQVAEAERLAEIRRLEWEAERERDRKEAEERRRQQAIKDSRDELSMIIKAWGEAKRIEGFFDEAEKQAMLLATEQRDQVLDRIAAARSQFNAPDALTQLIHWQTAEERYK